MEANIAVETQNRRIVGTEKIVKIMKMKWRGHLFKRILYIRETVVD